MALDVTVVGSALRQQVSNDTTRLRDRQAADTTSVQVQNESQRFNVQQQLNDDILRRLHAEDRLKADQLALTRKQQLEQSQSQIISNRHIDDQVARDNADFLAAQTRRLADQAGDAQRIQNQRNSLSIHAPVDTSPPAAAAPSSADPSEFQQLLAARNTRVAASRNSDQIFQQQQVRDLARSQQAVETLRTDPNALPPPSDRGTVVDVRA